MLTHTHEDIPHGRWFFSILFAVITVTLVCVTSVSAAPSEIGQKEENFSIFLAASDLDDNLENYQNLSPEEKAALKKKYEEWKSLPPEKQEELRRQMERLNNMSPEERKQYQRYFKQLKNLSPKEREEIQKLLDNWENLTPAQKEKIKQTFNK